MLKRSAIIVFKILVYASLLTPFLVSKDLLFPFVTTKAFYFRAIIGLGLPLYIYLILSNKNWRPNWKNPLTLSVAIFWLINLVSAYTGVNVEKSLWGNFERMGGVYYLLCMTLVYFYILLLAKIDSGFLRRLLQAAVLVAVAESLYGVLVALGMNAWFPDPTLPRISITFGNPIYVGSYLIFPLFLSLFFALQTNKMGLRIYYWLAAILQLVAIYLSGTRGAVVGLVLGLFICGIIYAVLAKSGRVKTYSLTILGIFIVLASVLFAFHNKLPPGSTIRRVFNLQDANTYSRLIQWKVALSGVKDHPLLGTGTENYYIIGNKYYNPEIYQYDGSWLDKPHNYILEILVTNGILGLLAYLGILLFASVAIFKAYRNELLTLTEGCVLFGGLLVYQIQNLFVFDSVAASMMFYLFLGLCGYLWEESSEQAAAKKAPPPKTLPAIFLNVVLVLSIILMFYAQYITNLLPARAAKNTNYGFAYSAVDPKKARNYFDAALSETFNLDPGETASKYADFAISLMQGPLLQSDPEFVKANVENALKSLNQAVEEVDNYPIYWEKLANVYLLKAYVYNQPFDQRGEQALQKAIDLAPKRVEALMMLAQLRSLQNRLPEAMELCKKVLALNPRSRDAKWQLAVLLLNTGKKDEALALVEELLAQGFQFRAASEAQWVIENYVGQKKFGQAIIIYQQLATNKLLDIPGYINLAKIYVQAGQKDKAIQIAQTVAKADPSKQKEMEAFIQSLK